jgi:hypothetical protein
MEERHRHTLRFHLRHLIEQGSFILDPTHNDVVVGRCAELRARNEAGMRGLDYTEGRRKIRADKNVEVRMDSAVGLIDDQAINAVVRHGRSMHPLGLFVKSLDFEMVRRQILVRHDIHIKNLS